MNELQAFLPEIKYMLIFHQTILRQWQRSYLSEFLGLIDELKATDDTKEIIEATKQIFK